MSCMEPESSEDSTMFSSEENMGRTCPSGIYEEILSMPTEGWSNLSANMILSGSEDSCVNHVNIDMPQAPIDISKAPGSTTSSNIDATISNQSSSSDSPSVKRLIPDLSFVLGASDSKSKKNIFLDEHVSSEAQEENISIFRSFSNIAKLFPSTLSLPSSPATKDFGQFFTRSLSAPSGGKYRSIKRLDSLGYVFTLVPSTPCTALARMVLDSAQGAENELSGNGQDHAPEGDAICRICLDELGEGETLRMECNCKGELGLVHQHCIVRWFNIRGNNNCDVCKHEVQNLPVTLLRLQSIEPATQSSRRSQVSFRHRIWHDVPILVIISMLAYFCFLEQLLVDERGLAAIAVAVPFSGILGFLSSLTSATMVKRRYVFVYAIGQFVLVVLFSHVFYSLRHMQAVVSLVLATFAGFAVAMGASSVVIELLRWESCHGLRGLRSFSDIRQPDVPDH